MKGFFVSSNLRPYQGIVDCGYYVDGGDFSDKSVEGMVENDEAYSVEILRFFDETVRVKLESNSREVVARVEEGVG